MIQSLLRRLFFKVYNSHMPRQKRVLLAFAVAAFSGLSRWLGVWTALKLFHEVIGYARSEKEKTLSALREGIRRGSGNVSERGMQGPVRQGKGPGGPVQARNPVEPGRQAEEKDGRNPGRTGRPVSVEITHDSQVCPDCGKFRWSCGCDKEGNPGRVGRPLWMKTCLECGKGTGLNDSICPYCGGELEDEHD